MVLPSLPRVEADGRAGQRAKECCLTRTRVDPEANPARPEGLPPLPANVAVPAFRLSERDQSVARELERIDPQLAGSVPARTGTDRACRAAWTRCGTPRGSRAPK